LKSSSPGIASTSGITGATPPAKPTWTWDHPSLAASTRMAASHDGPSATGPWHLRLRERGIDGIDGIDGGRGDATGLQVMHVHGHA
jgi:hypothetical protein